MKHVKHTIEPVDISVASAQTEEIELLDLGAASIQTKGGTGFNVEGVDCVVRGHFQCP